MKIVKFRIQNYKSVQDSGDCYLSTKFTILAGKNESGKTTILEALSDFDERKKIEVDKIPINSDKKPMISVTFAIDEELQRDWLSENNIRQIKRCAYFTVHKDEFGYSLDKDFLENLTLNKTSIELLEEVSELKLSNGEQFPARQDSENDEAYAKRLLLKANTVDASGKPVLDEASTIILETMANTIKIENELCNIGEILVNNFVDNYLPYFVFYSSFTDKCPDSLKVSELKGNNFIEDLQEVSNFDISSLLDKDRQKAENKRKKINSSFNNLFEQYWTQDKISLEISKDGENIDFWIPENEELFKPSQRSAGFQWYLSFAIAVGARAGEDKSNVILIDEPGLFLHAKAQKDMLKVLEKLNCKYPIIFSTHSPYLIDGDNLENVRIVEKEKNKTKIIGKFWSNVGIQKDTLTPIITAIGIGMNDSITDIEKMNNIIVEGVEDTFYLRGIARILKIKNQNFIYGGGAGNEGSIGTILTGWGCNVQYLLDNDRGGKNGYNNLKDKWYIEDKTIHYISKDPNINTVADLFSKDFFVKQIISDEKIKYESSNSEYIKNSKSDKILLARQFFQKIQTESIILDKESEKNFKELFKELGIL